MFLRALLVTIVIWYVIVPLNGSRILFVTIYGSKSHVTALMPVMDALSTRGHNITYLTFSEPDYPLTNDINVLPLEKVKNFIASEVRTNVFASMNVNVFQVAIRLRHLTKGICMALMSDPNFRHLVTDNSTKYDVIIMDPSFSECALSLIPALGNPPFIYYSTTTLYSWTAIALDIPSPFAFVPLSFTSYTDEMSFWERYGNTVASLAFMLYRDHYLMPLVEKINRNMFHSIPSPGDIERNASFVFANSHSPSVDFGRPLAPFLAEVGGTHCRPARPLPKELEDFINGSGDDGFVYFSIGSHVRGTDMDATKVHAFIDAFGRLKQRVIWKFENGLPDLPPNVIITRWAPQQDLLGHPKAKLFMTQGGHLSLQEGVYHAVPMLGFPVLAEHFSAFSNFKRKGVAEMLDYKYLDADIIHKSIMEMLDDDKYKENCLFYSRLFRDRPMKPIDTVVYWIEYIIRYKGGHHLRFNTHHLNFFQYFLLDVIAVALILLFFTLYLIYKMMAITCGFLYRRVGCQRHRSVKIKMNVQYKKLK